MEKVRKQDGMNMIIVNCNNEIIRKQNNSSSFVVHTVKAK